ncbi:hypothetical protein LWI29_005387 [Acer saccharum]|uniref:Uncharacterized protein n=1 Tax=Acer saccharum TaxID=4024 RepID=A0AA39S1E5_ACESA|nr:hypothetical protein LWI29_005387 [Acer saccharum]
MGNSRRRGTKGKQVAKDGGRPSKKRKPSVPVIGSPKGKDQKFKPYNDDEDKLPSDDDEEENVTQDVYEERHPNREMDKEHDSIATFLMLR